jgi:hypothetical protein
MKHRQSEKPAAAETANGLPNADQLVGSISSQNSKSCAPQQIPTRSCSQKPAARHKPSRYPIANVDCGFDERAFYVQLFFSRRDYLVWGPYSNVGDATRQQEHLQRRFGHIAEGGQR